MRSLIKFSMCAFLLITAYNNNLFAQDNKTGSNNSSGAGPVRGSVTDESGKPVAGVSIRIKGGKTVAVTDDKGQFRIASVESNAVLTLSSLGFNDYELQVVSGQRDLKAVMTSSSKALNEVVVVGYGTQKKRDITGAVTTFDTKSIEEKPIARVDQAMIGQMPGVQIVQQTGMPGAGFSIQVRGAGSITAGKEPLYVIDGFPLDVVSQNSAGGFTANPLNNINPNDIESLQVLKDAAAAAIYGSRAANGVVLITTKRGQIGKARIGFNAYTGVSKVAKKLDVLSADEWIAQATELENYKWVNSGTGRTADQTNAQRAAILGLAPGAYNTAYMSDPRWTMPGHPGIEYVNWQDSTFRNAPFSSAEISASGGTENVRYFFSGNYLNQVGTLLNSGYKNYGARANVEVNANKKIKLGFNLAPTYSETNTPAAEGKDNILMKLYNMTPIVEDSAGLNTGAGKNQTYGWATSSISPVATLLNTIGITKSTRILYSMYGDYQIIPGLTIRSSINYDGTNQNTKKYTSDYVSGNLTDRLNSPGKGSSGSYSGYQKQNFLNENTINFAKTIKDKHSISAVAGMSYNWVHIENFTISTAGGFANDLVTTLNNAIASTAGVTVTGNTTESNNTLLSYYGRAQYSYAGKYLLSASLRTDASSRFGANNRWGTFPSLSVGWRISQESFMDKLTFINDLKIRGSWGKAGNNNIGDYSSVPTLSSSGYSFGGNTPIVAPGQSPTGIPNPNLKWETSNTYDLGFDASILHNRINVVFDVYQRKSTDLLLNIPIPGATGFTSSLQNIGAVTNKGLEIGLNTVNIVTKDFQWSMNANIAFNKNEVTALGPDGAPINIPSAYSGNPPFVLQKGMPLFSYSVIKTIGILTPADMNDPTVAKLPKQTAGDAKYFDKDGNGIIDANDRVIAGQPNPKYTWGWTNNFRYKAFDLSIQMYGQHGGSILSFIARAIDNPANGAATNLGVWRDRFTAANQNYNAPRGKIGESYTIPYFTSDWLYSTDFWRIQNITLGYNLKSVIKTGTISAARVFVSAQNWFGHDKYKGGVNPEAQNTNLSGNGSYPLPGDYGAMPLSKTVTVGVNFSL
ncbi:SusC/RagA family TonB-linked outer membrane protein [Chitinophagaceae bacterium LWZ2-11]